MTIGKRSKLVNLGISIRIAYGSDDVRTEGSIWRKSKFQSASPTEAMTIWTDGITYHCNISIRIAYGSDDVSNATIVNWEKDFNPHRLRKR